MNFDGKIRQRTVSVAGLGRKSTSTTTNKEIIENARKKREQRQEDRTKQIASIKIQSIWRGVHTRSNIRNKFRQEFDSKLGGVQKIKALFQAQKKVFLVPSETLLSLLLLYHASHFLPNVSTTKARAIYLLGLLKESMDNESAESNVLSLLVDPNQGFLVASQIMSFIGTGLASLDLSSTSEEWSNFASALKHLFETNSLTSVTIQMVIRRLRMNILRAALLPLARSGVSHASALGFSTWAVNWISSDLAHSLKRPELWRVLLAGDASHSELAPWKDVSDTLSNIPLMYRVNLLRPLTALLAEQNMVGWRVLLQVTCLSSIHIFGDEKPNVKSVSVLLNCLQCALEDSSTKPDASKLALRALLRPASIPVTSDESTTLSFDLFDAIQKVFAEAPLVSLVRLMETPESFEHEFHRWRTGESVVPLLETDRRTAAGVKALELDFSGISQNLRLRETTTIEFAVAMNASSSETVSYLDKLASVVRVLCDRDLVSFAMTPMVVGIQSSELGLEQVNFSKKVCLGDSDFYTLATVFKSALMYLSLIIASAGTAIETTVVPTHADAPSSAAKLLHDPLNRNFSVHNSVLNTLAFSRSRDPLSGQLWGLLLRHFGSSGVWTEALAVHDDCHLNQIQRLRMTATGDAPLVIISSSRRDSSSNSYLMLESAAQNAGITVNELCVGASNVFTLFCAVYLHQLAATDDEELFSSTHSLSSQDLQLLVVVLKEHLNKLFVSSYLPFDLDKDTKQTARNKLLLDRLFRQTTFVKLWGALYARNERRPFYPQQFWQLDGVAALVPDYRQRVHDLDQSRNSDGHVDMSFLLSGACMKPLLTCLPQMIPFGQRIELLQTLITADRASGNHERHHAFYNPTRVRIRRDHILHDTVTSLSAMSAGSLKGRIQVEFLSGVGGAEAGIDGGGLTKEWADLAAKAIFNPSNGFFIVNDDQLVMPHPASNQAAPDHLKYFKAFGRLLGLIVYNHILVDAQFASTFLNSLLGRVNQIDDLWVLDKNLHRSLVSLKKLGTSTVKSSSDSIEVEDPVAALGLFFEVTKTNNGNNDSTEELIPGGSRVPVTRANVRSYIHRYANYKVNTETAQQSRAFLSGFRELVNVEWLSMFNARELQLLISGEEKPIDIADMRRYVNYSGGYSDNHPFIQQFWDIVSQMTPHEQSCLLKFVTSCSRQPLLGFAQLHPHFGIAQVFPYDLQVTDELEHQQQQPRLPTAATCMNLLKLPFYDSKEVLREKLLYAITSESGFELS